MKSPVLTIYGIANPVFHWFRHLLQMKSNLYFEKASNKASDQHIMKLYF